MPPLWMRPPTNVGPAMTPSRLDRPVFVVGSPRSGTTLLQNVLCRDPSVYRLGRESRFLWHRLDGQELTGRFPGREAVEDAYLSELYRGERPWTRAEQFRWALRCASQGTPAQYLDLPHELLEELADDTTGPFAESVQTETAPFTLPPLEATFASETTGPVRMVDKDTGHCWRLPELAEAFPDARFVFVVRDPAAAIRSLVAGWRHPVWFFTYRMAQDLAITRYSDAFDWGHRWWNFNLFPGYEDLCRASIEEVCAEQWSAAMRAVVRDGLPLVREGRAVFTSYERIVSDPSATLRAIAEFTGLDAAAVVGSGLDRVYMSMTATTWNPGEADDLLDELSTRARTVLDPVTDLIGTSQGVEDAGDRGAGSGA